MSDEAGENLIGEMKVLAAQERRMEAPAALEARLVAAFRGHGAPVAARRPAAGWGWRAGWAMAALILLAGGLWVGGRSRVALRTLPPSATSEVSAQAEDTALASGFIQLPSAERLGSNDDVNVVRIEVPRSAMLEVGIPVSPDRLSEPVEAEVLLGPDGLAHAVRFEN